MSERPVLTEADLQRIVTEMKGDGVWIAPSFATEYGLSAADETRIEQGLSGLAEPVRVILVEPSHDDPEYQGDAARVADAVAFEDPTQAIYLVPGLSASDVPRVEIKDHTAAARNGFHAEQLATHRAPDDLVERILQTAQLAQLSDKAVQERYQSEVPEAERPSSTSTGRDEAGGPSVWLVSGLVLTLVVLVVLGAAGWRRFVRSRTSYAPSASVLRRVKGAETRTRRQQAEAAALELSERIVSAGPHDHAEGALAHLEAARRLLDRDPLPSARGEADVVGALVLLRRGTTLLSTTGPSTPGGVPLTCWFNPLHAPGRHQVTWRDGARTVDVPACDACARQVEQGREPDDILDLASAGRTRHWFHLDLGVWNDTGFGAFSPDLPRELNRDPKRDPDRREGR